MPAQPCPHCGRTHSEKASFCPITGKPLAIHEAPAQPVAPPLSAACPNCGFTIQSGWHACPNCGAVFSAAPQPQAYQPGYPTTFSGAQVPPAGQPYSSYQTPLPPNPKKLKISRPLVILGSALLAIVVLLSVACLSISLVLGLNQTNRAARVLPAKTDALITFSPSIWQLPSLIHYKNLQKGEAVFAVVPGVGTSLPQILSDLPKTDVDFQTDVLPWIGNEVSVAQLNNQDLNNTATAARELHLNADRYSSYGPRLLLTAATRNKNSSGALLTKIRTQWENQGIQFQETNYHGVNILVVTSSNYPSYSFAIYKGMVMAATEVNVITTVIDTGEGDQKQTLYVQKNYTDTLKELRQNRLGTIFINWDSMTNTTGDTENPALAMYNLSAVENVGATFGLQRDGLRFDYALGYDTSQMTTTQINQLRLSPSNNALAKTVPDETLLYISGHNMHESWKSMISSIGLTSGSVLNEQQLDQILSEFKDQTGVDLEQDLLANMQGEYVMAVVRDPSGLMGDENTPLGFLFAIELNNPQQVKDSMENVMQSLGQGSSTRLVSDRIGNNDVWFIEDTNTGKRSIGYSISNNVLLLGTSERMLSSLGSIGSGNLSKDQYYIKMIKALPGGARHYVNIDIQRLLDVIIKTSMEQEQFEKEVKPYVRDLQSIGISIGKLSDNGVVRGTIMLLTR